MTSKSNFAVVEFKSCDAAEKCIMENDGTKVGDQTLQLAFAIPGYSGVDFVWNKPVNVNFKRPQVGLKAILVILKTPEKTDVYARFRSLKKYVEREGECSASRSNSKNSI